MESIYNMILCNKPEALSVDERLPCFDVYVGFMLIDCAQIAPGSYSIYGHLEIYLADNNLYIIFDTLLQQTLSPITSYNNRPSITLST